jgi:hypothetical protein
MKSSSDLVKKIWDRRQKSNTESNKDLTIGKSRSSQRASRFIDSSNIASNFSVEEEQKKEETPEPQSKLHIEESKIVKEKHERSLRRMQITTANKSKIVKEKHERSLRRMQITTNDVQTTTNNMQTTTNNMQITCKLLQISCKIVKEKHERSLRRMPITTNNVQTTTNNMQITANKLQNSKRET